MTPFFAIDRMPFKEGASFPITLKEGEIFLLGDDRENAEDSRAFGAVKAEDTLGEVMTVLRRRNL
ncbi:MAG: S26 family signal peptidase [Clostridia bacterium]|nr:S26 family signal peptidase [Clostridia bacterium]